MNDRSPPPKDTPTTPPMGLNHVVGIENYFLVLLAVIAFVLILFGGK